MATQQFRVPGVMCEHCVKAIKEEVSNLEGIQRIDVSIDNKLVTVEHSDKVNNDEIIEAINEAGYYPVEPL
jgi:copper ion binding protein